MPPSTSRLHVVRVTDAVSHEDGKTAARRWRKIFGHLPAAAKYMMAFGSLGSFSCLVGAVVVGAVVVGAAAALLAVVAATVVTVAMLGGRDGHSPFTRLMMIICAATGRRTEDYLVTADKTIPQPRDPAARDHQEPCSLARHRLSS